MLMLDTSVAVSFRDGDPNVLSRVDTWQTVLLPVVTRVELEGGLFRDPKQAALRRVRLDMMYEVFETAEFDEKCAETYRAIVAVTGYSRRKILDRMIAAQALVSGATLATKNPQDFADVPGLTVEGW
jgi:predicted nucleic acid-binding protein